MVGIKDSAKNEMKIDLHKLLQRQLTHSKIAGYLDNEQLYDRISQAYLNYEREIKMTNRAIDLVSTELGEANELLHQQFERYELAMKGARDGLWDWDCKTQVVFYSKRWKEMLGYADEYQFSTLNDWLKYIHPEDRPFVKLNLEAHLANDTPHFESEYRIVHADGSYRWMLARAVALRDFEGKATRVAGSQTDITSRKEYEEQLAKVAFQDHLTGLPNRYFFSACLEKLIAKIPYDKRKKIFGAVMFIDIDRFKTINDNLGHLFGDHVLTGLASRLQTVLRPEDVFARLGGDEFVILLMNIKSIEIAKKIAERIGKELETPFHIMGEEIFVSVSIGITGIYNNQLTSEVIIRNADTAMYQSKVLGRRRYAVFTNAIAPCEANQFELEKDLNRALEKDELFLVYQPIVSLVDFSVMSFEALIRWKHPKYGVISPTVFIPIAEEMGLIVPIGEYILTKACEQISKWKNKEKDSAKLERLGMSINLSVIQLSDPSAIERILSIIRKANLPSSSLKIEITESSLMKNVDLCLKQLEKFTKMNIELCIDDFGTGYSSLSYLHSFPFNFLKIDRSFIIRIEEDEKTYRMIAGIITLSHDMNFRVIAEGVENIEQLEVLKYLGCDCVQGYYFSPPVFADEAEQMIYRGFSHLKGNKILISKPKKNFSRGINN